MLVDGVELMCVIKVFYVVFSKFVFYALSTWLAVS